MVEKLKISNFGGWVWYTNEDTIHKESLDPKKCGKWMWFFDDALAGEEHQSNHILTKAIEEDVVVKCKHTDKSDGVACFYLNGDDTIRHKKCIQFFMDNDLIRKTKSGKYYNITFKYDNQTRAGEYNANSNFESQLKLDQFLNLETGKFK